MTDEEIRIKQQSRARVMGYLLIGFAILIFAISIVKMGLAAS